MEGETTDKGGTAVCTQAYECVCACTCAHTCTIAEYQCHLPGMTDVCISTRWSREPLKLYLQVVQQVNLLPTFIVRAGGRQYIGFSLIYFHPSLHQGFLSSQEYPSFRGWLSGGKEGQTAIRICFPKRLWSDRFSATIARINNPNLPLDSCLFSLQIRHQVFHPDEHFLGNPLPFFQMRMICLAIGGSGFLGQVHWRGVKGDTLLPSLQRSRVQERMLGRQPEDQDPYPDLAINMLFRALKK